MSKSSSHYDVQNELCRLSSFPAPGFSHDSLENTSRLLSLGPCLIISPLICSFWDWPCFFVVWWLRLISALFVDRLETANRQLSSRDYDGHEDKAAEGQYMSQSESVCLRVLSGRAGLAGLLVSSCTPSTGITVLLTHAWCCKSLWTHFI